MKNNFKEINHILRTHQNEKFVNIISFFKNKNKGLGTILATKDLYFSLLDKVLNKKDGDGDAFWLPKPKNGLSRPESIYSWLSVIDLVYLTQYSSKTTLKNAFSCLYKSGLIYIDEYNRIHIKYPVDGKFLSPKFAAIAILSKKKNLDENNKKDVHLEEDINFWEDNDEENI